MNTRFLVLWVITAMMVVFVSCKNNDEVFAKKVTTGLNIVNATADTLNFYLNGTRLNNTSSLFPAGQSYYLTVPAGVQNYSFKKAGPAVYNVLFNLPLKLLDSSLYSTYVYGESASETLTTQDELPIDTLHPDTTMVRFVNVSSDAGNLDVYIGSSVSFKSSVFKTSSAFVEFPGGANEIKVFQSGSSIAKVDTTITFQAGSIYTIFSKGLLNGKGNSAFNIGVALNH